MSTAVIDKRTIRRDVLARREGIGIQARRAKEERISSRVCALPRFLESRTVMLYASFRGEVDTTLLAQRCRQMSKRMVFPRVDAGAKVLLVYEAACPEEMVKGFCGIPEPGVAGARQIHIDEIDLVIVPGVAFDPRCRRIGYGGGFYDAFLERAQPFSVGLCFEEQMVDSIPYEPHDVPMDIVVTEERIIARHGYDED